MAARARRIRTFRNSAFECGSPAQSRVALSPANIVIGALSGRSARTDLRRRGLTADLMKHGPSSDFGSLRARRRRPLRFESDSRSRVGRVSRARCTGTSAGGRRGPAGGLAAGGADAGGGLHKSRTTCLYIIGSFRRTAVRLSRRRAGCRNVEPHCRSVMGRVHLRTTPMSPDTARICCSIIIMEFQMSTIRLDHQTLKANYGRSAFEEKSIKPNYG
ncbi:hypothetical protein EVAR_61867_1 [Eumeta japonica]|uniref:Uncharacterized protein n=1 Tax=Eumeta variegata TaxID=151549 RepID=A0A4C1ZL43_EUMVA|nr:hypothetical protein EVAR_61867_1 [Eumeta japonica]